MPTPIAPIASTMRPCRRPNGWTSCWISSRPIRSRSVKLQKDLREFIELLNSHEVEYLVVGGHAVAYHGHPRYTGDIDFFVRPSVENAARVAAVVRAFGFPDAA